MHRRIEKRLVEELTIVVREPVTFGNKFLHAGEEFHYVAHLCPDKHSSAERVLFVDQEGTEFTAECRAVPDALLNRKVEFIIKDKQ